MNSTPFSAVMRQYLDRLAPEIDESPDAQLLARFVENRDQSAFAALVRRHGRVVWNVCKQVLGHEHDAEDAFQATFLVLARNAATIRKGTALPSWLYGVAYRIAQHARRAALRRQARERKQRIVPKVEPHLDLALSELQRVLAEEVQRLPENLRAPFVLCCLEGKSKPEAATQLGWKEGTVSGRLARARRRMQHRLTRRGLTLSAVLCASALLADSSFALSTALVSSAIKCGTDAGAVAPQVAALAARAMNTLLWAKSRLVVLGVIFVGLIGSGVVGAFQRSPAVAIQDDPPPVVFPQAAKIAEQPGEVFTYVGRVLDSNAKPVIGAQVLIARLDAFVPEFQPRALSGSDGTFRFSVRRAEFVNHSGGRPPELDVGLGATATGHGATGAPAGQPEERANVTLWLPAEEIVQGRVMTAEGKPVAGVKVRSSCSWFRLDKKYRPLVFDAPDEQTGRTGDALPMTPQNQAVTDSAGKFTLRGLSRGWQYYVWFRGNGIVNSLAKMVARPQAASVIGATGISYPNRPSPQLSLYGSTFTHIVFPSKPITGIVRDQTTGKPLAGVTVTRPWTRDDDPSATSTTDRDGNYLLTGLSAGIHELRAKPASGMPYLETEVIATADRPGIEPFTFNIQLKRQLAVSGRVIDKETGKPLSARIQYRPMAFNKELSANSLLAKPGFRYQPPTVDTDKNGRFFMTVLPGPGVLLVGADSNYLPAEFTKADRRPGIIHPDDPELINCRPTAAWPPNSNAYQFVDVVDGQESLMEFALAPGRSRSVRIEFPDGQRQDTNLDGLKPGGSREVYYPAKSKVVGLAPKEVRRLYVSTQDGRFANMELVNAQETGDVHVKLKQTGALTGRLVDASGKPLEGISFQLLYDDGPGRYGVFLNQGHIERLLSKADRDRDRRTLGVDLLRFPYLAAGAEKTDDQGRFRLTGVMADIDFTLKAKLLGPPDKKGSRTIQGMAPLTRTQIGPGETLELGDLKVGKVEE
ncbi:hypothetical protein BH10PLA2_BH10PLA2_02330 [soil metagenome]